MRISRTYERRRNQPAIDHRSRFAGRTSCSIAIGEKCDQRAADRKDIARSAARQVNAQRPAVGHTPRLVEIQRAGQDARIVVAEAVAMAAIERAGRIERVVALEREQPEEARTVERDSQLLERVEERLLGRSEGLLVEPQERIAADVATLDAIRAAADAGGAKIARGVAAPRLGGERGDQSAEAKLGTMAQPSAATCSTADARAASSTGAVPVADVMSRARTRIGIL